MAIKTYLKAPSKGLRVSYGIPPTVEEGAQQLGFAVKQTRAVSAVKIKALRFRRAYAVPLPRAMQRIARPVHWLYRQPVRLSSALKRHDSGLYGPSALVNKA